MITINHISQDLLNIVRGSNIAQSEPISKRQIMDWINYYRALLMRRDEQKNKIVVDESIGAIFDFLSGVFCEFARRIHSYATVVPCYRPPRHGPTRTKFNWLGHLDRNTKDYILTVAEGKGFDVYMEVYPILKGSPLLPCVDLNPVKPQL